MGWAARRGVVSVKGGQSPKGARRVGAPRVVEVVRISEAYVLQGCTILGMTRLHTLGDTALSDNSESAHDGMGKEVVSTRMRRGEHHFHKSDCLPLLSFNKASVCVNANEAEGGSHHALHKSGRLTRVWMNLKLSKSCLTPW
jgi:hypothetical protein